MTQFAACLTRLICVESCTVPGLAPIIAASRSNRDIVSCNKPIIDRGFQTSLRTMANSNVCPQEKHLASKTSFTQVVTYWVAATLRASLQSQVFSFLFLFGTSRPLVSSASSNIQGGVCHPLFTLENPFIIYYSFCFAGTLEILQTQTATFKISFLQPALTFAV